MGFITMILLTVLLWWLKQIEATVLFKVTATAVCLSTTLFWTIFFFLLYHRKGQFCLTALKKAVNDHTALMSQVNDVLDIRIRNLRQAEKNIKEARNGLELRVKERSLELELANYLLMKEITIRSETEHSLFESNAKYRTLVEIAPFGIVVITSRWEIDYLNPKFTEIFGYTINDIRDLYVWFILAFPDECYRNQVIRMWEKSCHDGNTFSNVVTAVCRDGKTRSICFKSVHLLDGKHFLTCEDITQQAEAERALMESRTKYQNLFNNALVGLYCSRVSDGKILECNRQMAFLFGYESPQVFKDSFVVSEHYVDIEALKKFLSQLNSNGQVENFEARFTIRDGAIRWFSYSGKIFPETGTIEGVAVDISEKKQAEEQLVRADRLSSLAQLSAGIAHEIRNPLSSISLFTDILCDPEKSDRTEQELEILDEIKNCTHRISEIIKRVLSFARPSLEEKSVMNINRVIRDTLLLWDLIAKKSKVRLNLHLQENLPPMFGDVLQLQQVVHNLLINALDAMENGGVLTISTAAGISSLLNHKPVLLITISDTGIGIRPEDMENIFNPFFTTKPTGTGLGLAIAYKIIEAHGGLISLKSTSGNGSTFVIEFPVFQEVEP